MRRTESAELPGLLAQRSERGVSGCLVWTWARDWGGYGMIRVGGKQRRAHRLSWELANGRSIPTGMVIRHACDNPSCIEPRHLFLGTVSDNNRDRQSRGRSDDRRGEKCPTARLTWPEVRAIRQRLADREPHAAIAADYGVTREAISRIAQGRNWRPEADPHLSVTTQPTKREKQAHEHYR